jgi:hypothetical protein
MGTDVQRVGTVAVERFEVEVAAGETRLLETLLRFEAAHGRDLDEMRACFAPDALIESVASDGQVLGVSETVEAIRLALLDGVYSIRHWKYEELSLDLVISITAARHLLPDGGMRDETVYRLISGRNGLIWRVKLFASREAAMAHFELHGPSLGL